MSFSLKIMTPQGPVLEDEVESISLPGIKGYFGVLTNHAPMVSAIGNGIVKIQKDGDTQYFAINGGIAEISKEETTVLAEIIRKAAGPDEAEIELEEINRPTPAGH